MAMGCLRPPASRLGYRLVWCAYPPDLGFGSNYAPGRLGTDTINGLFSLTASSLGASSDEGNWWEFSDLTALNSVFQERGRLFNRREQIFIATEPVYAVEGLVEGGLVEAHWSYHAEEEGDDVGYCNLITVVTMPYVGGVDEVGPVHRAPARWLDAPAP